MVRMLVFLLAHAVVAQEVPVLSQKVSDGVWQFPAMTGLSGGSAFVAHRRGANAIKYAPVTSMVGIHSPFAKERMGAGGHLFVETVGVFQHYNASAQLAHHLPLSKQWHLSMALGTEWQKRELNPSKLEAVDLSDPYVSGFTPQTQWDLSPSVGLSSSKLQVGAVVNRVRNTWTTPAPGFLSGFYTGYLHYFYTSGNKKHQVEPSAIVRYSPSLSAMQNELWLFYTYSEQYFIGLTYVSDKRLATSVGVKWDNRIVVGYSFELRTASDSYGIYDKYSHEVVVRFNLNNQYYRQLRFDPSMKPKQYISPQKGL